MSWHECNESDPTTTDLAILQSTSDYASTTAANTAASGLMGLSTIGQNGIQTKTGFFDKNLATMPYVYLVSERAAGEKGKNQLEFVAIHEFGHVSGLRHEQAREEAKKDRNCFIRYITDREFFNKEVVYQDTTSVVGAYDPQSIMNDCWMDQILTFGTLIYYPRLNGSAKNMRDEMKPNFFLSKEQLPNLEKASGVVHESTSNIKGIQKIDFKIGLS